MNADRIKELRNEADYLKRRDMPGTAKILHELLDAIESRDKRIAELEGELQREKQYSQSAIEQRDQNQIKLTASEADNSNLKEDQRRLDWMESKNASIYIMPEQHDSCGWRVPRQLMGEPVRQAIDAAMQEPADH